MATYVKDTFTDTNGTVLSSHTPDIGGAWSEVGGGATSNITIQSDTIQQALFGNSKAVNATTASTADYQVSIDVIMSAATAGVDEVGVMGRGNFGAGNSYIVYYDTDFTTPNQTVVLSSFASGSETQLATYALTYVQGQTHNVMLKMQGSTISMLVDNVVQGSVTDTTWTTGTNIGIWTDTGYVQSLLGDNFLAQDIPSSGGTAPTPHMFASMGVGT